MLCPVIILERVYDSFCRLRIGFFFTQSRQGELKHIEVLAVFDLNLHLSFQSHQFIGSSARLYCELRRASIHDAGMHQDGFPRLPCRLR